jgi:carbon-monoxide dehydrogenase medium subunit
LNRLIRQLGAALKAKANKNVVAVAGGKDLLVRLHDRITQPWPKIIDIRKCKELHKITVTKKAITIGPSMTSAKSKTRLYCAKSAAIGDGAASAGSVQIRNRATIGGNIAKRSPAGDTIPPLYVTGIDFGIKFG